MKNSNVSPGEGRSRATTVLAEYAGWLGLQGRCATTIEAYVSELGRFLRAVEARGMRPEEVLGSESVFIDQGFCFLSRRAASAATLRRSCFAIKSFMRYMRFPSIREFEKRVAGCLKPLAEQGRAAHDSNSHASGCRIVFNSERSPGRHEAVWRRDRACALLCGLCGLRAGEVADLLLGDVVLAGANAWLQCRTRNVPVVPMARRALLDYLVVRKGDCAPDSPLFTSRKGERLPFRTLQQGIRRFLRDCGNERQGASGARACRKAFATALIEARCSLPEAAAILGVSARSLAACIQEENLKEGGRHMLKAAEKAARRLCRR